MLKQIMGEESLRGFLRTSYLKAPHSMPQEAIGLLPLLTWDSFCGLTTRVPEKDVLVVKNGRLFSQIVPKSPEDVRRLHDDGYSLVLRNTDRLDPALDEMARSLENELKGKVAIQLYSTPNGHHSFGWHYDAEEVFIIQTKGTKEYFLRENTVYPLAVLEAMPRDMQYEQEKTPTLETTLIAGDWLYIPGGWWHMAKAVEDSLSLSVGVMPPTGLDLFDALRAHLLQRPQWRQRFSPNPAESLEELEKDLIGLLQEKGASLLGRLHDQSVRAGENKGGENKGRRE